MSRRSDLMRVDPEFKELIRKMQDEDDMLDSDRQTTKHVVRLLRGGKKIMRL